MRLVGLLLWRDPRLFNYVILVLYFLNATRWAVFGSWADWLYWTAAFLITFSVTFGYRH